GGDGGGVFGARVEADCGAAGAARGGRGGGEEARADAAPPGVGRDRDRIKPRHRRARAEEDDRGAGEALALLGDDHRRAPRADEVGEAPPREPVGREHAPLERDERGKIAGPRLAGADGGPCHAVNPIPPGRDQPTRGRQKPPAIKPTTTENTTTKAASSRSGRDTPGPGQPRAGHSLPGSPRDTPCPAHAGTTPCPA